MIRCEVIAATKEENYVGDGLVRMQFFFSVLPRKGDVVVIPYGGETFEVTEVQITCAQMEGFDETTAISLSVKSVP